MIDIRGTLFELDVLNLPIDTRTSQKGWDGTLRVMRGGRLQPARLYVAPDGSAYLTSLDSVKALRALSDAELALQDSARAERNRIFLDSVSTANSIKSAKRAAADSIINAALVAAALKVKQARDDSLVRQLRAVQSAMRAPAATHAPHRWLLIPDSLPPGYLGDDLSSLYARLALLKKDEFESTAAFIVRAQVDEQTWLATPVGGSGTCLRPVVSYDADAGELDVSIETPDVDGMSILAFSCDIAVGGQYRGTNAFNASVMVTKTTRSVFGLALFSGRMSGFAAKLPLAPAEAQRLKPRIRLVAWFKSAYSGGLAFAGRLSETLAPTRTSPIELTTNARMLSTAEVLIAAVDPVTGKILGWLTQ